MPILISTTTITTIITLLNIITTTTHAADVALRVGDGDEAVDLAAFL
jgi:hypothetical protein